MTFIDATNPQIKTRGKRKKQGKQRMMGNESGQDVQMFNKTQFDEILMP